MWVIVIEITKIVVAGNFTCLRCIAKQHCKNNKNFRFTNNFFFFCGSVSSIFRS